MNNFLTFFYYFFQARSIQQLARKDFENLRQDNDGCEPQPKIMRKGRPLGKKLKNLINSAHVENIGPESFSDTTLGLVGEHTNRSSGYNLRKGSTAKKFHPADTVKGIFHGSLTGDTCTSWLSDWENEFPGDLWNNFVITLSSLLGFHYYFILFFN